MVSTGKDYLQLGAPSRKTEVEISSEGELLAFEWLVFGHGDHGEHTVGGKLSNRWRVKRMAD
jgi:urease accessory protein UreH